MGRQRMCCNCRNCNRIKDKDGLFVRYECTIDGHIISFDGWCRQWKKNRSWKGTQEPECRAPDKEIVRCKDCVWWKAGKSHIPFCHNPLGLYDTNADDFCSYGERR